MIDEGITDYEVETNVFPAELLAKERWFVWKLDEGRKIPRAPWANPDHVDKYVSWKDESMWTDFEEATEWVDKVDAFNHASCIPAYDDESIERIIFFDFDDCRDPDTGEIHPHAWKFIQGQNLHAAISTSGTGLHGFGWGSLPEDYKPSFERELPPWKFHDEPSLEVYASARFIALTGNHIIGTPIGLPDLGETAHDLFHRFGSERVKGTTREPDVSREELADVETTTNVEDIYDAIAHTRPRDIRLRSTVTEERADGVKSLDPSWEHSESGTRLAEFDDHWLYRKGNHRLDALQVVALEERIITNADEYPSGDKFRKAVDALRDRGAHIPELETSRSKPALKQGDSPRPSASTDGGVADTEGSGTASQEPGETDEPLSPSDGDEDGPETTDEQWDEVYRKYSMAEKSEERLTPRYQAVDLMAESEHWLNVVENEVLWRYNDSTGVFQDDGESYARELLVEHLREQYRQSEHSEICDQIRGRYTIRERDLGGPDGYVATENAVLEITKDDVKTHDFDPSYRFITSLETPYDPEAECPRFEQFLQEAVNTDAERKKLQEFAGYCLHHWDLPYHKALFLVGPTASGKSTWLDTIRAMLGSDAASDLTPQQMTTERFGAAELYGTWANIRNDIPASMIENVGQFKEIIAGDPMKAEKKFKNPFMFEPTAKHMFSANQLPDAETDDEAFYRRILLVAFPTSVPRDKRDPDLDNKLQDELPGVLNWALEGLQRLMQQQQFTADRTPGETQRTWEKWGSSVDRFASVGFEEAPGEAVAKSDAYRAYIKYCEDESIPAETQHKFTRKLKQEGIEDGRTYVDGKRQRCYLNIELTSRAEQYLEGDSLGDTSEHGGSATGGKGLDSY